MGDAGIRRVQTRNPDPQGAVAELKAGLAPEDASLVVVFASTLYPVEALGQALATGFGPVPLIGCTTSGEIGPLGYGDRSLAGVSFPKAHFSVALASMDGLGDFSLSEGGALGRDLASALALKAPYGGPDSSFAFLLVDGLSVREEQVARAFQGGLGKIRLFGGSAGDDMGLSATYVFHDGAFRRDSAVLAGLTTDLPFALFRTQHFSSEEERLVVTEAEPARRIVREINGLPAAAEYARLAGVAVEDLDASLFAAMPVVVVIDGTDYIRSIQKVNPDGSLTFFSAIDEGIVFRVARSQDLLGNLRTTLEGLRAKVGEPSLTLLCDCILRRQEILQKGLRDEVGGILESWRGLGFNTYGEQIDGVHVNQTLTGIAIGQPRDEA